MLFEGSAVVSARGTWRYRLDRPLRQTGVVAAVFGVNPSTATADVDDQTIRKVVGFGLRLGWSRVIVGNLFGYRSANVRSLRTVGPDNDRYLHEIMGDADVLVAAWGTADKLPPRLHGRIQAVLEIANQAGKPMMCWGRSMDGSPRHPLMVAYSTSLQHSRDRVQTG